MEDAQEKINLQNLNIEEYIDNEKRPVGAIEIDSQFGDNQYILFYDPLKVTLITCEYYFNPGKRYEYRKDYYYYSTRFVEKFWSNEFEVLLQDSDKELSIRELIAATQKSFINYFGLKPSIGPENFYYSCDAGLGRDENKVFDFITKFIEKFYISKDSIYERVYDYSVGLVEWREKGHFPSPDKKIRNVVISTLRSIAPKGLKIEQLTYRINRKDIKVGIPKPFSEGLIGAIIMQDNKRFINEIKTGEIKLASDLEYLSNFFKENRKLLHDFNGKKKSAGILAIMFIGKEFPLKEAKEYVLTRPIIYLHLTNNLSSDFDDLLFGEPEELLFTKDFNSYLKAIIPSNISVKEWVNENVSVSFYEESYNELKLLFPQVIEKFSPILNMDMNPGNLFQYTLGNQLEAYKQALDKVKDKSENQIDSDTSTDIE